MATDIERLSFELLGLPASTRAYLAGQLIASLEEKEEPGTDSLWIEEAERRAAEIDAGKVSLRPAEDVLRQARENLR